MKKEEILSRSREEHKEQDLYVIDVQTRAANVIALVALILATLFFVLQSVLGLGFNFGLYAIVFSIGAVGFIFKAKYIKRKRDIVLATIYSAATVILTAIHIYQLITSSTVL